MAAGAANAGAAYLPRASLAKLLGESLDTLELPSPYPSAGHSQSQIFGAVAREGRAARKGRAAAPTSPCD